jgi:hypothetical protein
LKLSILIILILNWIIWLLIISILLSRVVWIIEICILLHWTLHLYLWSILRNFLWVIYRLSLCVIHILYRLSLWWTRDSKVLSINLRNQFLSCEIMIDRRTVINCHFWGIRERRDSSILHNWICNRLILFYKINLLTRLG